jgi:DNA-binding transcriptional ArsR family regulator
VSPIKPPTAEPRLAHVAALVADASRARMLSFLLGGEFASAGELATCATVSAATASAHLAKLLAAGMLVCEQRGRHRYYRLADGDVARALEALALVAERGSHARTWASPARARLRQARCCYGHLAGRLGVQVLQAMFERGWLHVEENGFAVTPAGAAGLQSIGLDGVAWQRRSAGTGRGVAYACLDWSERRDHLAGKLAAALLDHFISNDWLRRPPGERALKLTPKGEVAFAAWLRLDGAAAAHQVGASSCR